MRSGGGGYRRVMLPRALAGMILAIALLAAGCGGEDGGQSKAEAAKIRRAYVAKVDALCKKVSEQSRPINRKIQALIEGSGTYASRVRKGAPLLQQTYDAQAAKLERFKSIEPPEGDRAQIQRLTKSAEALLEDLRDGIPAARRGDLPAIIDLATDATGNRAKTERLGLTYGFREDCFSLPIKLQ